MLGIIGLRASAEEPFIRVADGKRRVPDLVIYHSLVGGMLGEAEYGETTQDPIAKEKLEARARARFKDVTFKGYDFIALFIYPKNIAEAISNIPESDIDKILLNKEVGLGLAVRGDLIPGGGRDPIIIWLNRSVKVVRIPQALDSLIKTFFHNLKERIPLFKADINDFIESINSIIDNTAKIIYTDGDQEYFKKLGEVAVKLGIAWERIKKERDKITITVKFILLISALIMMFHEIVRNERLHGLKPIECENLTIHQLVNHFHELIHDEETGDFRYEDLNSGYIQVLKQLPVHEQLNNALRDLCLEVKNNYVLVKRMGWDILSLLYQRLLSETYRHAFATFYTKLPSAKLLASLSIESLNDRVIDPASGTGSLLLASLERRKRLLGEKNTEELYREAVISGRPLIEIVNKRLLKNTVGLDALKPACIIASLNLRMATHGSPPRRLSIFTVPVGYNHAGSLDLLLPGKKSSLPKQALETLVEGSFDVVIMNPPFTRVDRISYILGEDIRRELTKRRLEFGGERVSNILTAGLAKPFMILADKLVKPGGRIATVLPNSILSRPTWRDVRRGLLNNYNIEYIVVSWAPSTPNFSSDTSLREILLVARKKCGGKSGPVRIINLYKRVDDLTNEDIEKIARFSGSGGKHGRIYSGNDEIASITLLDLSSGLPDDNLYRFIAFKNSELLNLHTKIVTECSVKLKDVFEVGSGITQTKGIASLRREHESNLEHLTPALWGSGSYLNINKPLIDKAPHLIGVKDPDIARIKYWKPERTFYKGRVFLPRRIRIVTQNVLMIMVGEDAVSNVWYPIRPRVNEAVLYNYGVYFNSILGFIHLLGERLETEGLFIELKKSHLEEIPIPDFRRVEPVWDTPLLLSRNMPRFDDYINYMSEINRIHDTIEDSINHLLRKAGESRDPILSTYSNRAQLDRIAISMINRICPNIRIPGNLYQLVKDEIEALSKIMEPRENNHVIEDEVEPIRKRIKTESLEKWMH